IMAGMYAVYHGPEGLKQIAMRTHSAAVSARAFIHNLGYKVDEALMFDTIRVRSGPIAAAELLKRARDRQINLRDFGDGSVGIAFDETVRYEDLWFLFEVFSRDDSDGVDHFVRGMGFKPDERPMQFGPFARTSPFLTHPVFNRYHSEHDLL